MSEITYEWAEQQLKKVKASPEVAGAVLPLIDYWLEQGIPENEAEAVLTVFRELAQGHSLVPEAPEETWVPMQRGFFKVGDKVRVKHDAFSGENGLTHNGRRGRIVAIRSGDIIFRSEDDLKPFLDGVHYPPDKLEKRIR